MTRGHIRILLLGVSAWLLLIAGCASAQPLPGEDPAESSDETAQAPSSEVDPELKAKVQKLFRGYEYRPTREDLLKLGTEAEVSVALRAVYLDAAAPMNARTNSLAALGYFPGDVARETLEGAITSAETGAVMRRSALMAYGVAFEDSAVALIAAQGLNSDDLHTRNTAVKTLQKIATVDARSALEARLEVEKEASVRATLEASLADWPQR